MLRIRIVCASHVVCASHIVCASVVAALAVVLAVGSAAAQTASTDQPGSPLHLLAGLLPPHQTKPEIEAKKTHAVGKRGVARKVAKVTHAGGKHHRIAAAQADDPAPRPAPSALPPNFWPVADASPAAATPAPPPEAAPTNEASDASAVVVDGETVQIAAADQINALDLAADDNKDAPVPQNDDGTAAAPAVAVASPAVQRAFAAPIHKPESAVGSASWTAQVLAAAGGAVAAGTIAWFLIGGRPRQMYE